MKKTFSTVSAVFLCCIVFAQNGINGKELTQYLFEDFAEGKVLQKSGSVSAAKLNYNTLTQEMIFQNGDQNLALDQLENIDTVYLQNKKFIAVGHVFYEVATNTASPLFIQYITQVIPPGAETGFGKSQTTAIDNISDLKSSGKAYALKLPDDYKLNSKTMYWLKKNNAFVGANSVKDVQAVFPDKAAAISDFAKANKIKFKNPDDVIKLINFCNQ